jgi:hypothetical protein
MLNGEEYDMTEKEKEKEKEELRLKKTKNDINMPSFPLV